MLLFATTKPPGATYKGYGLEEILVSAMKTKTQTHTDYKRIPPRNLTNWYQKWPYFFKESPFPNYHFGHSMLVFGDVLATTLSMIWAFLLKSFDPCSLHTITDACLKCCIAWLHRLSHLQILEYMQCFVSVYPGSPRPNKACCLEYVCIALLLSLETVHKSIILDFGQTNHHTTFKRSIDLWSN